MHKFMFRGWFLVAVVGGTSSNIFRDSKQWLYISPQNGCLSRTSANELVGMARGCGAAGGGPEATGAREAGILCIIEKILLL